jgi:hypothetical protein
LAGKTNVFVEILFCNKIKENVQNISEVYVTLFMYWMCLWVQKLVLRFREQNRLKLFENRMLRVPKWDEVIRNEGNCIVRRCMFCTPHQKSVGL